MKTIISLLIFGIISAAAGFYGGYRHGVDTLKPTVNEVQVVKEVLVMDELQQCITQGGSFRMHESLWKENGYKMICQIEAKTLFDTNYQPK